MAGRLRSILAKSIRSLFSEQEWDVGGVGEATSFELTGVTLDDIPHPQKKLKNMKFQYCRNIGQQYLFSS